MLNLTEAVIRPDDSYDEIQRKVRLASILGTLQSTRTDFRYLRKVWRNNTEEERLLGVSLTGIMDHPVMSGRKKSFDLRAALEHLREEAIETNEKFAERLGVGPSVSVTCVKPSGTVSQLVNAASGIHPRFSHYYIRTIRGDKQDPLSRFLVDSGVPYEEDVMSPTNWVFSFPVKAPQAAETADKVSAIDHLNLWEIYQDHWCEHKPSVTIYYTNDDFLDIMAWVWKRFDKISGISFLPYSDHTYQQAPYQEITKKEYDDLKASMPVLDWDKMVDYEQEDNTVASQELACVGGSCEVT